MTIGGDAIRAHGCWSGAVRLVACLHSGLACIGILEQGAARVPRSLGRLLCGFGALDNVSGSVLGLLVDVKGMKWAYARSRKN